MAATVRTSAGIRRIRRHPPRACRRHVSRARRRSTRRAPRGRAARRVPPRPGRTRGRSAWHPRRRRSAGAAGRAPGSAARIAADQRPASTTSHTRRLWSVSYCSVAGPAVSASTSYAVVVPKPVRAAMADPASSRSSHRSSGSTDRCATPSLTSDVTSSVAAGPANTGVASVRSAAASWPGPSSVLASAVAPVSWADNGGAAWFSKTSPITGLANRAEVELVLQRLGEPRRHGERVGRGRVDVVGAGDDEVADAEGCDQLAEPQRVAVRQRPERLRQRLVEGALGGDVPVADVERATIDHCIGDAVFQLAPGHGQHARIADVEHAVTALGRPGAAGARAGSAQAARVCPGAVAHGEHAGDHADDDGDGGEQPSRLAPPEAAAAHVEVERRQRCRSGDRQSQRHRHQQHRCVGEPHRQRAAIGEHGDGAETDDQEGCPHGPRQPPGRAEHQRPEQRQVEGQRERRRAA